jgi:predicted HicB family RNase H-like nuclease
MLLHFTLSEPEETMRRYVHSTPVHFRADPQLVADAEAKARRDGMSMSELMRAALRREVREAA